MKRALIDIALTLEKFGEYLELRAASVPQIREREILCARARGWRDAAKLLRTMARQEADKAASTASAAKK